TIMYQSAAISAVCVLAVLLVFYSTGVVLLSLKKQNGSGSFALPAIAGMLIWIAGYAILQTGGKTVMWLLFPLLLSISVFNAEGGYAKRLRDAFHSLGKHILPVALLIVLFAVKAALLFDYESIIPDNAFYARIVSALSITGQENEYHFLASLDAAYTGVSPYHYGELWLASPFAVFSGTQALLLIATPVISVLLVQALFELINRGNETLLLRFRNYILALLVLGCSWLLLWPLSKVPQLSQ
ncbi:MAG: hypothetical protein ACRC3B_09330, partial [Bacteroidia bacterium]